MGEQELGFGPTIMEAHGEIYIEIYQNGRVDWITLTKLIIRKRSVVGRATICWKGFMTGDQPNGHLVIKH